MKHIYFFIILMTILTIDVTGQVTLVAPSKMVRSGDSVVVELLARSRDTLSTMQFTLSWNPSLLSFGRLDTIGGFPPSAVPDEYGISNISQGKLSFVWISATTNGLKIVDSLGIFKLVFKAVGTNGTNSPVQFVTSPTQIKASNVQLVSIPVMTQEGNIKIGTTATEDKNIGTSRLQLEQNKPNPFHNQTSILFNLQEAGDVFLSVFDFKGQKVMQKELFFASGQHEWILNTEGVLATGLYVYNIRTHNQCESKVMIKE